MVDQQLSLIGNTIEALPSQIIGRLTERTARAYRRDLAAFAAFCADRDEPAVPAHVHTVVAYLEQLATRYKFATVERALYAIRHAHISEGRESPTSTKPVRSFMSAQIREVERTGEHALLVLSAGVTDAVLAIEDSPVGRRDRALVLANFYGSLSRGELTSARREHLVFADDRAFLACNRCERVQGSRIVTIEREPNPEICPVRALERWAALIPYAHGPLFAHVADGGMIRATALSGRTISRIISRRLDKIGRAAGKTVTAKSLRGGVVAERLGRGMDVKVAADRYGRIELRHVQRLRAIARRADLTQRAI